MGHVRLDDKVKLINKAAQKQVNKKIKLISLENEKNVNDIYNPISYTPTSVPIRD